MAELKVKVGDIVELIIRTKLIDEDENATTIDISDYDREYDIIYFYNTYPIVSIAGLKEGKGYIGELDNIEEFIESDFLNSFEYVSEYEVLDTEYSGYLEQKARIKIKALKED